MDICSCLPFLPNNFCLAKLTSTSTSEKHMCTCMQCCCMFFGCQCTKGSCTRKSALHAKQQPQRPGSTSKPNFVCAPSSSQQIGPLEWPGGQPAVDSNDYRRCNDDDALARAAATPAATTPVDLGWAGITRRVNCGQQWEQESCRHS